MAESPLSIRMSEETKSLFNQMAEQGEFENKGEFVERLLVLYQSEMSKGNTSALKPVIEVAQAMTARLLEALNGASAVMETDGEKRRGETERLKTSFEEEMARHTERIEVMEVERQAADVRIQELESKIAELESAISEKDTQINEYRESEKLHSLVKELIAMQTEKKPKKTSAKASSTA